MGRDGDGKESGRGSHWCHAPRKARRCRGRIALDASPKHRKAPLPGGGEKGKDVWHSCGWPPFFLRFPFLLPPPLRRRRLSFLGVVVSVDYDSYCFALFRRLRRRRVESLQARAGATMEE